MSAVAEPKPVELAVTPDGVPVVGAADALSLEPRLNDALLVPLAAPLEPPVSEALIVAPFKPGIWPFAALVAVTVPLGTVGIAPSVPVAEPAAL
jgi:hypothetical protein